jgi:hypothetical protein
MRRKEWQHPISFVAAVPGAVLLALSSNVATRSAVAKLDGPPAIDCLDSAYYREQAARFRRLAAVVSDDRLTGEMLELAAAYETKAAQLEAQTMIDAHAFRPK